MNNQDGKGGYMAKTKRKALLFLIDQMKLADSLLDDEELGLLYRALYVYGTGGVMEDLDIELMSDTWYAIFNLMADADDEAAQRYDETCERNRVAANIRWSKEKQ